MARTSSAIPATGAQTTEGAGGMILAKEKLPVMLLFLFAQKFVIEGITMSGINT